MFNHHLKITASILASFLLALSISHPANAAGPAPVNLRSTDHFVILAGAAITSTGGGIINGDVGASPIAGSAIGVTCAQVNGNIYAVDASGPPCAIIDATLLTTAKGDLTAAYNDAAGRTPTPTGPELNPGLIPGSGNIGGMTLAPGLYKFTVTAMIDGADVTLSGGPDDVWIFQCSQNLVLANNRAIVLAGGARAENIFWQVGTSATIGTFATFKGTILADQAIVINTSSTLEGRALAFSAGVTFNGDGANLPAAEGPEIAVEQPSGSNMVNNEGNRDFGLVLVNNNTSLAFTITNSGGSDLTGLNITVDGNDSSMFTVTVNPIAPVGANGSTTFTVRFQPTSIGPKSAVLHIASNDADENPFNILVTGTGTVTATPEIGVAQPVGNNIADGGSKNFGSVLVNSSTSLIFTITNSGTANLTIVNPTINGADASMFTITASPSEGIGPNVSTSFTIRFLPTSTGAKSAAVHIANNDSDENPYDINLSGTGTLVGAPEIAVSQPNGTDIADGGSKGFGSVAVGNTTSLTFTITNSGFADLTGLALTIDGADETMFSVTGSAIAPVVPNGSTTFVVQFAPGSSGPKTAMLHIGNNDGDENPFDITLTGTGTILAGAPEIAVAQPVGTDIADGGTKNFGSVVATRNVSRTFTITNSGTANLTGLTMSINGANATMFTVTASPTAPVVPNGSTTFVVRFTPIGTGLKTAALHIANNDGNENPFDINLTGTGTGNLLVKTASPIVLNPQTGLFEQTIRLTNSGLTTITAARLLIQQLPGDVRVYNASGIVGAVPYVQHNYPIPQNGSVRLVIEYYRASRVAIPRPTLVAQDVSRATIIASGTVIQISRSVKLPNGRCLVEFNSVPGGRYTMQYSSDKRTWKTVDQTIVAPGNRVQWYDDGAPKTESQPVFGSRFYRVIKLR